VPPALAGLRFDQALAQLVPQHSRSRLQAWIDAGNVTLDGSVVAAKRRVTGGERIVVAPVDDGAALPDVPQAIPLDIIHEDAALVVVNKAAGLVVHPGSGNRDGTLLNALVHHDPGLAALPRAGIVHRLDKDTSGVMIVAKNDVAHLALARQLQGRKFEKEYIATVLEQHHGRISDAARALGIQRTNLYRKMRSLKVTGRGVSKKKQASTGFA